MFINIWLILNPAGVGNEKSSEEEEDSDEEDGEDEEDGAESEDAQEGKSEDDDGDERSEGSGAYRTSICFHFLKVSMELCQFATYFGVDLQL